MYAKDRITIIDRREMLRVKLKNLADEARLIRREERRTHGTLRDELYLHRINIVRSAARETLLAYGFIKGLTLAQMEPTRRTEPNWDNVKKMLKKYGPSDLLMPELAKKAA